MDKNMLKPVIASCLLLALSACAPVQVLPITGNGAKMDVQLANESTNSVMRSWGVSAYQDERCEKEEIGVRLSKGEADNPITLPTDRKVTLTFGYSEVRLGAGAGCVYSLTFAPVENHRYTARFAVIGNSTACKVALSDNAGGPVAVTTPAQACMSGVVSLARPNGEGSYSPSRPVSVYSK